MRLGSPFRKVTILARPYGPDEIVSVVLALVEGNATPTAV